MEKKESGIVKQKKTQQQQLQKTIREKVAALKKLNAKTFEALLDRAIERKGKGLPKDVLDVFRVEMLEETKTAIAEMDVKLEKLVEELMEPQTVPNLEQLVGHLDSLSDGFEKKYLNVKE